MIDYILKVKTLSDQLATTSEKVFDRDQVLYLLPGLSADYNSFIVSITSKSKGVTFEHVTNLLLAHESCLEQQLYVDESTPIVANLAYRPYSNSHRQQSWNHSSRKSHFSGPSFHNAPKNNSSDRGSSTGSRVTCQLCLRLGHTAYQYYRRFDPHLPPPNASTSLPTPPISPMITKFQHSCR
ncbi:uncharacterized protein LOC133785174 [Humulus lupulus]|uniref:uncharacterized protein LOC133785174 n=1 Tax=Humulus lupulus TaxID=3486 RepID=UPI002B40CFDC|nr:uncharacterized protein LOC133785174 [Humulus lupulus]